MKSQGDAIAAPAARAHTHTHILPAQATHSQRARQSSTWACFMHRQQPVTFACGPCTMQEACPQSPDQRERRPARSKHGGSGLPCWACLCQVRCPAAAPAAEQQRVSAGCCFRSRVGGQCSPAVLTPSWRRRRAGRASAVMHAPRRSSRKTNTSLRDTTIFFASAAGMSSAGFTASRNQQK